MFKNVSFIIAVAITLCSCNTTQTQKTDGFVTIEGQKFVDSNGRQLIFSGINYISKNPKEKYMPQHGPEIFQQFSKWGINCIRLGIIWDGLEPEPGKYNEAYFAEIDKRIQWAGDNGIYVYLDMHQDLYGSKFSDGAPVWATLDEGQPHVSGAVWSDSYLISPAVQTAFDNFWKNAPAPDGVGLQDHYAYLWKYIAARYANNTTVIGFDIMNEPFMGSAANNIMPVMLTAYAELFARETGKVLSADEVGAMWAVEDSRMEALRFLDAKERYSKVVDSVYDLNAAFEKNELQNMYQKVANAIREVDKNHILFLNHSYFSNTGVSSAVEPTKLADGTTDYLVAYAAHGYDLVVDTKEVENPGYERVEFIFERINETGKRMNVPVLVGEWGAYNGKSKKMVETARQMVNIIEGFNFSNTYWAFYDGIGDEPYFQNAIVRPFPIYVSGSLSEYGYNTETGEFTCVWEENEMVKAPTEIFIPNIKNLKESEIKLTLNDKIEFEYFKDTNAGRLIISPSGKTGQRKLNFAVKKKNIG
jgi:endoglycosylceramidase